MKNKLKLEVQRETYGICRLSKEALLPQWLSGNLTSVTRTDDELSVVCKEEKIPKEVKCERGWKALKILGPLDLSLVGVLALLTVPLAEAGISIFVISTFNTDYLLVKEENLEAAVRVLEKVGYTVTTRLNQ